MANREIKDEIRPDNPVDESTDSEATDETNVFNPNLLKLDEDTQKKLVAIVKEDYTNSLNARQKTDWGTDNFGEGTDFDTKFADLITLYEGPDMLRPER